MKRHPVAAAALLALAVGFSGWSVSQAPNADKAADPAPAKAAKPPTEDELHALVAAGGVVRLPAGRYELTRTLTVRAAGTSILGDGPERTVIVWKGGADKPAVEFAGGSFFFRLEGLTVLGPRTTLNLPGLDAEPMDDTKCGIGLAMGYTRAAGEEGTGTITGTGIVTQVEVRGFDVGVQIGRDKAGQRVGGVCASEVLFDQLKCAQCKDGVRVEGGGNSLNFRFRMLNLARCWTGVTVTSGSCLTIDSGSATHVGGYRGPRDLGAILTVNSGGVFALRDFRSENSPSGRLMSCSVGEATATVEVSGCESSGPSVQDRRGAIRDKDRLAAWGTGNCNLTFRNNLILDGGGVGFESKPAMLGGAVRIENNRTLTGSDAFRDSGIGLKPAAVIQVNNKLVRRTGVPVS
jgi:hypothetical protein